MIDIETLDRQFPVAYILSNKIENFMSPQKDDSDERMKTDAISLLTSKPAYVIYVV